MNILPGSTDRLVNSNMKLKIEFAVETPFALPCRPNFRPWTQLLFGTRHTLRTLAVAEWQKPYHGGVE
jgi:hypothetical protein